jgi:hypothetical protein
MTRFSVRVSILDLVQANVRLISRPFLSGFLA